MINEKMQKAADAAFEGMTWSHPEKTVYFQNDYFGRTDAAKLINSPEYRAGMGNQPFGFRVNHGTDPSPGMQNYYFDPKGNETWSQYLARIKQGQAEYMADAKQVPSNASVLQQMRMQKRYEFGKASDRYYVDSSGKNFEKVAGFYLRERAPYGGDEARSTFTVFQNKDLDTSKTYGLKGGQPFGGAKVSHEIGMDSIPSTNTSKIHGKKLGWALSSNPSNEIYATPGTRYNPATVSYAGRFSPDASKVEIVRPAFATNLNTGNAIPVPSEQTFSSKALNILRGAGPAMRLIRPTAISLDAIQRGNASIEEQDTRAKGSVFDPNSKNYSPALDFAREAIQRGVDAGRAALDFGTWGLYNETTGQNTKEKEPPTLNEIYSGKYYGQTI